VDARTDIFAFAAVVYEMATGKRAFEGKSQASLIAAILEREPPAMSSLQPMTPPALDRVVKRCLAKDPDDRWQTTRDLEVQLKWIVEGGSQVASVPSPPVTRLSVTLPSGQQLAGLDNGPAVAFSPDGTHLAYVARQGGTQQIYLRAMDSLEAKPIPGTEGAFNPFFSPDGQWVGFFAGNKLKKVSLNRGVALTLGDAAVPHGADWGNQGMIAFSPVHALALQEVSDGGGSSQLLTRLEKGDVSQRWPEFLPGGNAVLFAAGPTVINFTYAQVAVQSIGKGERRNLIQGATHPRYAHSGHLVYAQRGTLMAVPFDAQRLEVTGTAVPAAEGVLQSASTGAAQYSLSATGSLVYVSGGVQSAQRRLVWVGRNGAERPVAAPVHTYLLPRLSPDGRRVTVAIAERETQIWLYDLSREALTRLTFEGNTNLVPVWTRDGKRIVFASSDEGPQNLFWQLADGGGGLERLITSEYANVPNSWSPDGQLLSFIEVNPATGFDIWVLRMGDTSQGSVQVPSASSGQVRKAEPFLRTPFNESAPRFSPDGCWLAYVSNESGRYEVYVQPYPGPGGKWQISTEGGMEPVWNPSGRELFFRTGDKMMAVGIATEPGFAAGKPRVLFEGPYLPTPLTEPNYDVSPDGKRFLMVKPSEQEQAAPTQINVVLNWFEELKRRVPAGTK
jgi:serine/threonine-protein kinase